MQRREHQPEQGARHIEMPPLLDDVLDAHAAPVGLLLGLLHQVFRTHIKHSQRFYRRLIAAKRWNRC